MSHINKHTNKTDAMLVHRILKEWKTFIGTFYDEKIISSINEKINYNNLVEGRNVQIIEFPEVIGYGYNRKLEKYITRFARVVIEKKENIFEVVTAYPELALGTNTKERFTNFELLNNIAESNGDVTYDFTSTEWKLYIHFLFHTNYTSRFVARKKNSQTKLYIGEYIIKFSNGKHSVFLRDIPLSVVPRDIVKQIERAIA